MKERHTGTPGTFLLLLLIPWESDRWKLVCQTGRLSNRSLELPPCKQHIKARFFPCTLSSPPNICPLSPSVSPSALSWLSHTSFSSSITLFQASGFCSSVAAIVRPAAGSFSLPLKRNSQLNPSPQTFSLQSVAFLLLLLHSLSAASHRGMKEKGGEEEIMVCLCGAKQTDWQMDSPSDAQQR